MTRNKKTAGFTLIELMIVVAIIAVIAAIAIPKLMSARISANENAAIATLRTIAGSQQQLQASAAIDTDGDGGGEYGYFGELAGINELRIFDGAGPVIAPAGGVLDPPYLATAFGAIVTDGGAGGIVERQGYYFKIFLPDAALAGEEEILNGGTGGAGVAGAALALWNSNDTELYWCCYAWPVQVSKTGNRAFFINQEGDVAGTSNISTANTQYDGVTSVPAFSAAYDTAVMDDKVGFAAMGFSAVDTNIWTQVGN